MKKLKNWWKSINWCRVFWHSDGDIIEYGNTQCIKKCSSCGETYMWP